MAENSPLWEALNDIRERITRMEASLESYTEQISERCQIRADRLQRVEDLVADLEKRVWVMIGASAVLSSLGTAILSAFLQKLGGA